MVRFLKRISSLFILLFFYLISLSQIHKVDIPQGFYAFTFQEDNQGRVWLGLSDGNSQGGLGYFKNNRFILVSGTDSIPLGSYHTSLSLPDGSMFFTGNVLNNQGKSIIVWVSSSRIDTLHIPFMLKDPFINSLALINKRDIWIGTGSGLLINSRGDWDWKTVQQGLPTNFISTIYQDFRGLIWVGTESGIAYFFDDQMFYPESGSRIISSATLFFSDSRGYLWCGARFASEGVSVYNGEVWETFSGRNGLIDNSVSIFYQDQNANLWVGSCFNRSRGGVSVFDGKKWESYSAPEFLAKPCVDAIISDDKGRVWFGGSLTHQRQKGITVYDGTNWHKLRGSPEFPAERVITFFKDSAGNIWISSFEGLFIVNSDFQITEN